ncbi:MAG TPA: electron transfer flavoprotein subunit alpha/FixB family protein, partial [Solirubrobacterales bacterium]|nr:electron transfer flavoprotein subunit alpha/FixB family protein [Solirubrobacterales bacterium]
LNAFEIEESGGGDAEVEELNVDLSDWSTKATMVQRGEQRGADVNIEDADILVGGGRGLGKAEGFQEIAEPLADALGGAVAATRAVVDAGWFPYAGQIGQTGKTVAPKLYLAVGISGAIQHKVGMQSSENIVAINKDPNAPIFEFSDLGIVGDLHKIVPKLTEAIKAKKGG